MRLRSERAGDLLEILKVLGDPVLPVYAIIAIGYLLGRRRIVSVPEARSLNRLALTLFLPLLIFGLINNTPITAFDPVPVLVYLGAELILFAAGIVVLRKMFGLGPGESALVSFSGVFSNTVMLVLPISVLLYPPDQLLPITAVVMLDSTLTFAGIIMALQIIRLGHVTPLGVLTMVARSPLLIAISLGIAFNLLGVTIPHPVVTFIEFNGRAAPALALFALGVVLSQTKITLEMPVVIFTIVKCAVFPLTVWAGLALLAPASPGAPLFVLASAGPAGAMAFSLALLYDVKTDKITQIILVTNVLSLLSLSLLA